MQLPPSPHPPSTLHPDALAAALTLLLALLCAWTTLSQSTRHAVPPHLTCALTPSPDQRHWRCADPSAPPAVPVLSPPAAIALGVPMDVNEAQRSDLLQIDGLGVARADAVLRLRAARGGLCGVEELLALRGVGEKTLARWGEALEVREETRPKRCGGRQRR